MTRRKLTRWVEADDLTKLAILDLAKELREKSMSWQKISVRVAREFGVRVSWATLCRSLIPETRERHQESARRYNWTHPLRVKKSATKYRLAHLEQMRQYAAEYRLKHPERVKQYTAKFRLAHPERMRQYTAKHQEKKRRLKQTGEEKT